MTMGKCQGKSRGNTGKFFVGLRWQPCWYLNDKNSFAVLTDASMWIFSFDEIIFLRESHSVSDNVLMSLLRMRSAKLTEEVCEIFLIILRTSLWADKFLRVKIYPLILLLDTTS